MSTDADRLPLLATADSSVDGTTTNAAAAAGPSLLGSHASAAASGVSEPGSLLTTASIGSPGPATTSVTSEEITGHVAVSSDENSPQDADSGFRWADHAQTLRAHQRDEAQVVRTSSLLSDVLRIPYVPSLSTPLHAASGSVPASSPSPARFLLSHPRFLPALARLAYYGLTFGAASQTIGEEYVDILPYSTRRGDFPSRKRRAWAVAALVMAPELLALIRERLRRGMTRQRQRRETASESTEGDSAALTRRAWLLRLLESKLVSVLPELWFAWFLIGGGNVDWSKSLAGLRYISPLAPLPVSSAGAAYQPVGWMVMLSLVAKLWPAPKSTSLGEDKALNNHSTDEAAVLDEFRIEGAPALECSPPTVSQAQQQKTVLRQDELGVAQRQCPLCLSPRGVAAESGGTAVTECGHIFCWSCIHDWADEKMECPLCRQALRLERLTPAYNL